MMLYISIHYAFTDHLNIIIYKNGLKLRVAMTYLELFIESMHTYLY